MRVTVELTYELSKLIGTDRFHVEDVATVKELIEKARERVGADFDEKVRLAAIVVNGVVASYRSGVRTKLEDGDIVSFVKAAAGG